MKKNHTGRFIAFLIIYTFIAFPTDGIAALPFTIKPGHPRVYVDSTRVAEIRAASQATTPLNGIAFPQQAGTLRFDIYALPRTDTTQYENLGIFDGYDSGGIFVREFYNSLIRFITTVLPFRYMNIPVDV